jgi:DNA replication and repair protein RecF
MRLERLWLTDFRNFDEVELVPASAGLTVITGANGQGKTNLLEAVGYVATLSSFRGVGREALVRAGASRAVVRAEARRDDRHLLVEIEVPELGRDRVMVNRQRLRRARDLWGALRVTVFSPDDLDLVTGGPAGRRRLLDDALGSLHARHDAARADLERVIRQRASLLRQAGGRLSADLATTLDVFDERFVQLGEALASAREELVARISPKVAERYVAVSPEGAKLTLCYERSWSGDLASALRRSREEDLRRATTNVGPHRDEMRIMLEGRPVRTHGSRGEQRSVALALRLGIHDTVSAEVNSDPVLLLDDVFSELDSYRSEALLAVLPGEQTLLTTAGALPQGARPELVVRVDRARLTPWTEGGGAP